MAREAHILRMDNLYNTGSLSDRREKKKQSNKQQTPVCFSPSKVPESPEYASGSVASENLISAPATKSWPTTQRPKPV